MAGTATLPHEPASARRICAEGGESKTPFKRSAFVLRRRTKQILSEAGPRRVLLQLFSRREKFFFLKKKYQPRNARKKLSPNKTNRTNDALRRRAIVQTHGRASLHITHYSLHITHYSLLSTLYSLLITHYTLHFTHYTLLITLYSLLFTHYSLLFKILFFLSFRKIKLFL